MFRVTDWTSIFETLTKASQVSMEWKRCPAKKYVNSCWDLFSWDFHHIPGIPASQITQIIPPDYVPHKKRLPELVFSKVSNLRNTCRPRPVTMSKRLHVVSWWECQQCIWGGVIHDPGDSTRWYWNDPPSKKHGWWGRRRIERTRQPWKYFD